MTEATEAATPYGGSLALGSEIEARTPSELFWRRLRGDRLAMGAVAFLIGLILMAIFAPLVVDALGLPDPNTRDPSARDIFGTATGPSSSHPLGVDDAGRDVASRVIYGARISLIVAFLATGLATLLGVVSGVLAGFRGGWVDTLVSRSVDVLLAVPYLLLATGIAASCSVGDGCLGGLLKPGLGVVIFVIAFTSWTYIARIVRGETLSVREREFVEAARAAGASDSVILFREILPNLVAPIVVYASVLIPQVILYEAALSFLGVGISDPTASWGQMISDATSLFPDAWWYMLFPGVALVLTVIAFNIVGDALQDALNPKASRGQ
jgi:ABC-type dipeptide/oligopeptide/nickel transport system permease subunit